MQPPAYSANFRATLTVRHGVRKTPFRNGMRWSFVLKEEGDRFETWGIEGPGHRDIWPIFVDEHGVPLPFEKDLHPGRYVADMIVLAKNNPANAKLHQGVKFYMCEGAWIIADGVITSEPTGLTNTWD